MDKKRMVIEKLFKECSKRNNYTFNNNLVKEISKKIGFCNPFREKLPKSLLNNDYCIIHLGNGQHQFIKDIDTILYYINSK